MSNVCIFVTYMIQAQYTSLSQGAHIDLGYVSGHLMLSDRTWYPLT